MQIVGLITSVCCSIARYNDEKKEKMLHVGNEHLELRTGFLRRKGEVNAGGEKELNS